MLKKFLYIIIIIRRISGASLSIENIGWQLEINLISNRFIKRLAARLSI